MLKLTNLFTNYAVLILILLDVSLGASAVEVSPVSATVLILILLDVSLGES